MKINYLFKKAVILLIAISITGLPFLWLHKPVRPSLVNLPGLILLLLTYLTCFKDLRRIKLSLISILPLLIVLFGLFRFKILPPSELMSYDLWLFGLGLFLVLEDSELKSLLKFSLLLSLPLTIFHLYSLPLSIKGSGLLLVVGLLLSLIPKPKGRLLTKGTVLWGSISTSALILLSCHFLIFEPGVKKDKRVLFDSAHQSTEDVQGAYTTNLSTSTSYGHANLSRFLAEAGYKIKITTSPITSKTLENEDILVLLMSSRIYHPSEVRAINGFVKKGGSLLVIGDHTNIDNTMSSFNPVIEDFGIRLRFDTVWLTSTSRRELRYRHHPLVWDIKRISPSVGASLDLSQPAQAIVTSGYADYSDNGEANNIEMAYLGNSTLDKDEQLGDLCLGAVSVYGQGRVLVLPDSAYFQNTSLYRSYDFAYRIFDWLNRKNPSSATNWCLLFSLPLLLLFLVGIILTRLRAILVLPYSSGIVVIAAIIISSVLNLNAYPKTDLNFLSQKVLIDLSHNQQYTTYWSARAHSKLGLDSLIQQVSRIGLHPVTKENGVLQFSELKDYSLIIIVAPNTKYSKIEIANLKRYVEEGGSLLIADGPRRFRVIDALLKEFGLELDRHPLAMSKPIRAMGGLAIQVPFGKFQASHIYPPLSDKVTRLHLVNPCQVKTGRIIADIDGLPVITSKPWKKGKIIVIGDDRFFANYISETETDVVNPIQLQAYWDIIEYLCNR